MFWHGILWTDQCRLYLAYCGMTSIFYILPTAEWQVFSVPYLLRNNKFCLFLAYCGMTSLFYTLPTEERKVFSILCLLRNDVFSLPFILRNDVLYTLSTAELQVFSTPYVLRNLKWIAYCGMTSVLCTLPDAEWQVLSIIYWHIVRTCSISREVTVLIPQRFGTINAVCIYANHHRTS